MSNENHENVLDYLNTQYVLMSGVKSSVQDLLCTFEYIGL